MLIERRMRVKCRADRFLRVVVGVVPGGIVNALQFDSAHEFVTVKRQQILVLGGAEPAR